MNFLARVPLISWGLLCNSTQRRKSVVSKYSLSSHSCITLLGLLDLWASAGPVFISYNKAALQSALWTLAHCRAFSDISCVVLMGRIKARSVPSLRKCSFNLNVAFPRAGSFSHWACTNLCYSSGCWGTLRTFKKLALSVGSALSFKWDAFRIMWHTAIFKRLKQCVRMWALQLIAWTNYT